MNYEVIDAEQRIAVCHIKDLTAETVAMFLRQWEQGATIGNLTLFYDRARDYVVLNKDNKRYPKLLELTEEFLTADKAKQEELKEKAPKSVQEEVTILKQAAEKREIQKEIKIIKAQTINLDKENVLEAIWMQAPDVLGILQAYSYGIMQGKRAERARRKRTCCQG